MSNPTSADQDSTPDATSTTTAAAAPPKRLPKGVVLGADGKPCRSCTSFASWATLTKQQTSSSSSPPSTTSPTMSTGPTLPPNCPPDVEKLGRSTWTLLHTMTATYPERAPAPLQAKTGSFITLFAELYPCWACAADFREWMGRPGNEPRLKTRDEFGLWMCRAHNAVNEKLGKETFDCAGWEGRWRTGTGKGAGEGCE